MERINHHNYETWLMLYLDNELSTVEKQAVEAFIEDNPEVKDELISLKEVIFSEESLEAMPGKDKLLMPEIWQEDKMSLQQTQLLLLADNALSDEQKAGLEIAISQSPLLQKEWSLLQKTILPNEIPASMPGKENLYRHEHSRVIPLNKVFRIAAAASVIAFGIFFAFQLQKNNPVAPFDEVVIQQQQVLPSAPNDLPSEEKVLPDEKIIQANPSETKMEGKKGGVQSIITNSALKNTEYYASNNNTNSIPETIMEATKKEPIELLNNTTTTQIQPVEIEIAGVDAALPIQPVSQPEVATKNTTTDGFKTSAQLDSFYENEWEQEEEATINIAGAKISKQRVRGIYRSITRPLAKTFEKNSSKTYETK